MVCRVTREPVVMPALLAPVTAPVGNARALYSWNNSEGGRNASRSDKGVEMEIIEIEAKLASRSRLAAVVCVATVAGLGSLAGARDARAGAYHVYSCRTPAGAVAPADGWSGSVAPGGAYDDYALNTCANGGALIAALGDETIHVAGFDKAVWTFSAPAGETIAGATLWRAGDLHGTAGESATYQFWLAGPEENKILDECIYTQGCSGKGLVGQPLASANRLIPTTNLGTHLYVSTSCGVNPGQECKKNAGDANGYTAAVYLYAADIVLEQSAGPHASNVTGELTTAPVVRGTSDVAFDATDPGSGVYEALFSVDGQVVQRAVVDEDNGRCKDVGGTSDGRPAFLYVQPCKQSVSVDVPFDTTRAIDGAHRLVVSVIDAAGNSAPVLDRKITIANPPPVGSPNGTNASAQASLSARWISAKKARITSAYGRAHTITGRLTRKGGTTPIVGAKIDCTTTRAYAGAKPVRTTCATTGPDGRFAVKVPRGASSCTVRLAYREHIGDALPVATRTLVLTVRAGVKLRVSPRTTSAGQSIHLTGVLLGKPIPRGGKQLVLEARSPSGRWIQFDVLKTNRKGRFHDLYRFRLPGPVDYRFRAVSKSEADFPFATGASNTVRVHER